MAAAARFCCPSGASQSDRRESFGTCEVRAIGPSDDSIFDAEHHRCCVQRCERVGLSERRVAGNSGPVECAGEMSSSAVTGQLNDERVAAAQIEEQRGCERREREERFVRFCADQNLQHSLRSRQVILSYGFTHLDDKLICLGCSCCPKWEFSLLLPAVKILAV